MCETPGSSALGLRPKRPEGSIVSPAGFDRELRAVSRELPTRPEQITEAHACPRWLPL
jgi:hypothetical protein